MSFESTKLTGDIATLTAMLRTKRPHGSATERNFIATYLDTIEGMQRDNYGNRYLLIGPTRVMWSSHTDTVHTNDGSQRIAARDGVIGLHARAKSNCLGADCTAGVWLMCEMIAAGVPGLYVFHRAEECGGLGSTHFAKHSGHMLAGIDFCIALDRKGNDSIITHQMGERCASDAFADSIAAMLPISYRADKTGLFTDSANYVGIIAECTNLSVHYYDAHSSRETLDVRGLSELRAHLLDFDEARLVAADDGSNRETDHDAYYDGAWYRDDWDTRPTNDNRYKYSRASKDARRAARSLREFVTLYPDEIADMLEQYGLNIAELYDEFPYLP